MNHRITPTNSLAALIPALDALAISLGRPVSEAYEVEDGVVRGKGWAEPVGDAVTGPFYVQIAQIQFDKAAQDAAAAAQAEEDRAVAALVYVPRAISNADLRRGLISSGINPQLITDYLQSLPESAPKWTALADWEYANYFERAHPMLDQLAPAFGLNSGDVNAIYRGKPEYPMMGL